jgi:hypothetical protein
MSCAASEPPVPRAGLHHEARAGSKSQKKSGAIIGLGKNTQIDLPKYYLKLTEEINN